MNERKESREFILRLRVPESMSSRKVAHHVNFALERAREYVAYDAPRYQSCRIAPDRCTCPAYPFPHARGYGKCKEPRV